MRILLPKQQDLGRQENLFFLLGPVQGGGEWQERACRLLEQLVPMATIAVPCRWDSAHPLSEYFIKNATPNAFQRQTRWERYYLNEAARSDTNGCILAWLPCESKTDPRRDGQPYARDSYGEVGEWRGRMMCKRYLKFVIGAEFDFPGYDVMKENWDDAFRTDFLIYSTLEETVQQAVIKAGIKSARATG